MKFRKKPVVIEAVQITDETFVSEHPRPDLHPVGVVFDPVTRTAAVDTLEGRMTGNLGDWIITGVRGEKYFCKPDIFAATYEQADNAEERKPCREQIGEWKKLILRFARKEILGDRKQRKARK